MNTGIFIRAKVEGRWESIDIGNPRLRADELLRWLAGLSEDALARTIVIVRQAMWQEREDENV